MTCKRIAEVLELAYGEIPVDRSFNTPAQARSFVRAQEGTSTQTVICSKERFDSVSAARSWVSQHGFRTDKVDVTEDSYRFRQFNPSECAEGALGNGETFATIELTQGVKAVICKKSSGRAEDDLGDGPFSGMHHADFRLEAKRADEAELDRHRGWSSRPYDDEKKKKRSLYEVAISSEAEIERWFGIEVLGHGEGEVDASRMARGAAVLVNHQGDQVGVVEPGTFRIDPDRRSRAYVRFSSSQRGQEVQQDVEDQIRQTTSVGYFVKDMVLSEVREVGRDSKGNAITVDVFRVTRWMPAELSLVSVPADISVGVGRSAGASPADEGPGPAPTEGKMAKKVRNDQGVVVEAPDDDPRPVVGTRESEVAEILELCEGHDVDVKQQNKWIRDGKTAKEVATLILQSKRASMTAQPGAEALEAMDHRSRRRYSYSRAILRAAQQREGTGKFDGLEAEVHQELSRRMDASIKRHDGVYVPWDLRTEEDRWREWEARQLALRTLDSKVAGKGAETIFEQPGELIEVLRQQSVAVRLGARMLTGLTAPVSFPKQTGRITAFWVGENPASDVTDSDVGFGIVNLQPKTIQASSSYSRQLLVQTSIDAEGMVRSELGAEHALLLDRSAFHGKGASGEPTGIYKAPDVNVEAMSSLTPTYVKVVDSVALVADDNALLGTLGFVTTPLMAGKLKTTPEHATAQMAGWIWQGLIEEGLMAGYRAIASNQISKTMSGSDETGGTEHGGIFGNWQELLIGNFAGLELIVDPFAKKKRGLIEVTSFQMADLVLRHGESFCKWTAATLL